MELSTAVQEAIRANLSQAVAGEMAAFIKQAKKDSEELESIKERLADHIGQLSDTRAKLAKHAEMDARMTKALEAEDKLLDRELVVMRAEAKICADVANASRNATLEVVQLFLRVPTVRTSIQESVGVPVAGSPGGNGAYPSAGMVLQTNNNRTETRTEE